MNGSKTLKDRKELLSKVDHFIFNSKWSLNRFKVGINNFDYYKNNFSVIYQSVNKPKINFKKNKILFPLLENLTLQKVMIFLEIL